MMYNISFFCPSQLYRSNHCSLIYTSWYVWSRAGTWLHYEIYWLLTLYYCYNTTDQGHEYRKAGGRHRVLCWICWWVTSPRGFRSCLVYVYTLNLNQIACAFSLNNKETIVIDLLSQFDNTVITSYSQADYNSLLGSSYFFARALSSVPWGIFADKYGRKPCIVISILSV